MSPVTWRLRAGEVELDALAAGNPVDRPLLLLHGFTGAKEDFGEVADGLAARGLYAVAPDLRGHGASDKPAGEASYSLDTFRADVVAVVDALGWERFTLLGHSMGGMVAQLVGLSLPDRVDGLVLMDTSSGPPDGFAPEVVAAGGELVRRQGTEALVEVGRGRDDLLPPAHRRVLAEKPGYREFSDRKLLDASDDMWLAMSVELLAQDDRLDALRTLRVPTLVVVGEEDEPFLASSQRMAAAIPGAELVVVPHAAHSPQIENRPAWEAAVHRFLDRLAGGA